MAKEFIFREQYFVDEIRPNEVARSIKHKRKVAL